MVLRPRGYPRPPELRCCFHFLPLPFHRLLLPLRYSKGGNRLMLTVFPTTAMVSLFRYFTLQAGSYNFPPPTRCRGCSSLSPNFHFSPALSYPPGTPRRSAALFRSREGPYFLLLSTRVPPFPPPTLANSLVFFFGRVSLSLILCSRLTRFY